MLKIIRINSKSIFLVSTIYTQDTTIGHNYGMKTETNIKDYFALEWPTRCLR